METLNQPLDACWWQTPATAFPPNDAPLLAPYGETRPGFEVLCWDFGEFPAFGVGQYLLCTWNIWTKDDPATHDQEKQQINAMQQALGVLDDETRYLRLQIPCLMRCFYAFPATVDMLLAGIAAGEAQLDGKLSCEPPWQEMRLILRHRRGLPFALADERHALAHAYREIISSWMAGCALAWLQQTLPAHAQLAERLYRYLGPPDERKTLDVQRVCVALLPWAYPPHEPWENRTRRLSTLNKQVEQDDELGRLIAVNNDRGSCHHSFFRHLDYQLAMIGAGGPVTLPGKGEERQRILTAVTNYVHALGSWLAQRMIDEAIAIWPDAEETLRKVYATLGKTTPVKRWLVACLWKHLQESQAHCGRGALDVEPERFALPAGVLQ